MTNFKYKITLMVLAVSIPSLAKANVAVPTEDTKLRSAYISGNRAILEAINDHVSAVAYQLQNQTEVMSQIADTTTVTDSEVEAQVFIENERRKNAERFSVHMGAKVKPACGSTTLSSTLSNGAINKAKIEDATDKLLRDHVERNAFLSESESVTDSNNLVFLTNMDKIRKNREKRSAQNKAVTALYEQTNDLKISDDHGSEFLDTVNSVKFINAPFPPALTPDFDDPKQAPETRSINSFNLWKTEALALANTASMTVLNDRAQTLSPEFINYLIPELKEKLSGENAAISRSAAVQIMNRYRYHSADWQRTIGSNEASIDSKMADIALMNAQSLNNQDIIIQLLSQLVLINSANYALAVNQAKKGEDL